MHSNCLRARRDTTSVDDNKKKDWFREIQGKTPTDEGKQKKENELLKGRYSKMNCLRVANLWKDAIHCYIVRFKHFGFRFRSLIYWTNFQRTTNLKSRSRTARNIRIQWQIKLQNNLYNSCLSLGNRRNDPMLLPFDDGKT